MFIRWMEAYCSKSLLSQNISWLGSACMACHSYANLRHFASSYLGTRALLIRDQIITVGELGQRRGLEERSEQMNQSVESGTCSGPLLL